MVQDPMMATVLFVFLGVLAAIVYCMRVLVLMERRVARIEEHIDGIAHKILVEEQKISRAVSKRKR